MEKKQEQPKQLNLETQTPQQLLDLKKALESDIQTLQVSFQQLRLATQKFGESKQAVNNLSKQEADTEIMVPLTSSLYVTGKIHDTEKVLVELGGGYFAEQKTEKAMEYCDRKVELLTISSKKVGEIIDHKSIQLQNVTNELQRRVAEIKQKQAEGQATQ